MRTIHTGVACNLDADILQACYPLFEASKVEAIEWSFDALYNRKNIPDWFLQLLQTFADADRLVGHGVYFSLFSGRWTAEQQAWLKHLSKVAAAFNFNHITEHFGFMTGADFHSGAPLSIPYTNTTLAIGQDRLARIYDGCGKPVGLENLAFSYSLDEVKRHGEFLEKLITPVNGFIILDLHNLYCHLQNFSVSIDEIIKLYPLHKVREVHISGGSWEQSAIENGRKVRRDTHDGTVPYEVFIMLEYIIPKCPNLQFVILEQLGTALHTQESREAFATDYLKMHKIVKAATDIPPLTNDFIPASLMLPATVAEDEELYRQQTTLSEILETAASYSDALQRLQNSSLANSEWQIENWAPYMLETAISIAQKWKKGD